MPTAIIKKFHKEYGKKHGKEVFYATANKEGRNPESFRKTATAKAAKRKATTK